MLTNNKKSFVRSIAMLLAMLMVLAVCLTGCGNKNALAKAEEAKSTADSVMAALSDYIKKDDTAAVEALVKAALDDSVATADELNALAAQLEKYVTADDVATLIKDEVAKSALASAMTKDQVLEILKDYYTKDEVDTMLKGYFGEYTPAQVLAILADAMSLKDWNATSDVVLATIASMQTLSNSVQNATYTSENMVLLNEKLAPLGIVAFTDTNKDGKITPADARPDKATFEKLLEYTILRVATTKEMEELKAAVDAAVAVPTFESEFAALQAQLFGLGELVVIGEYDANDKFEAETYDLPGYYHGKLYNEGDKVEVQAVTLADKAAFHEFAKAHDALVAKYLASKADATGKNGWLGGTVAKVYEVAIAGKLSIDIVAMDAAAPINATERGLLAYTTLADTATNEEYLGKLYIDGKLYYNEVLASPLYADLEAWIDELDVVSADFMAINKFDMLIADVANVQATAGNMNAWQGAYAAAYVQLSFVQLIADALNDMFQGDILTRNNFIVGDQIDLYAVSFLYDTIYSNTSAMMTKDYAKVTDAEFLAALTAAMCEDDGVNSNYDVYLVELAELVDMFLMANGQSYNGFLKADLYKQMVEKSYDLLWPKYRALAQEWANEMLNDYISVAYYAMNNQASGQLPTLDTTNANVPKLIAYMGASVDNITENDLTEGFVAKFLNGGKFEDSYNEDSVYAKIGKNFNAHNLAMYYKNNGVADVSLLKEGQAYTGATMKDATGADVVALGAANVTAALANPLATIAANAELITLRLTGSKLYVDMQIAGANKDELKASGVPVQEAFYDILKNAVKGFDEIYNRFLVDQYMSDDLSDYQKMVLNDTTALVAELVDFYNLTDNAVLDSNLYVTALEQYLTGVSGTTFSANTAYTVVSKKIARFTPGKSVVESTVSNFTLVNDLAGITVNHFDTSSSEGVALVGTQAMADMDAYKAEAIAEMENILIKAKFIGYLDTARGSWNELWLKYYGLVGANDYDTQTKLNTLVTKVQDTLAVIEFYATLDGYKLDEYKTIYTTKVLPLIAGKHNAAHLALLSGKDIETILADDGTIVTEQWNKGKVKILTAWTWSTPDSMMVAQKDFAAWVPSCEPVTPYAPWQNDFVGTAAQEIDALLNSRTAYTTSTGAIVKLY